MVESIRRHDLAPATRELLHVADSATDERARTAAIEGLAAQGDSDACRVLIELFERSMWRSTQLAILRTLGRVRQQRGLEFLLRVASNRADLALAAEAVLALGTLASPVAGEFLLTLLREDHPLRREAIVALTSMATFPCEAELAALTDRDDTAAPGLLPFLILALARRRVFPAWARLGRALDLARPETTDPVLTAGLLAAGRLGDDVTLGILRSLDTRERFFADQLRQDAIERIESRRRQGLDDIVCWLLTTGAEGERVEALRALRGFPRAAAWEAFQLLGAEASPGLRCLARAALFDPGRADDDRAFLVAHWGALPADVAASLVRLHARARGTAFSEALYAALPSSASIELMGLVPEPEALGRLARIVGSGGLPLDTRIAAVNALVAQAHMAGRESPPARECGRRLVDLLAHAAAGSLQLRLIRALGQTGHADERALAALARLLERGGAASPSVYRALSLMDGDPPARIVLDRLRAIGADPAAADEVDPALRALARMGRLPDVEPIRRLGESSVRRHRPTVLRILVANRIEGLERHVDEELAGSDHQGLMLAAAAAALNHSARTWSRLLELLDGPSPSLAGRALYSLATGGGVAEHMALLQRLGPEARHRETALALFRNLTPAPGADYRPVVVAIDRHLAGSRGIFADREVVAAATNLRDTLVLRLEGVPGASRPPDLDQRLGALLAGYAAYGEPVKATLRSAELMYRHPELFDETVDRSTIAVAYVKAIDLMLQDRVGAQIFLQRNPALLHRMQSRIVELGLDGDALTPAQIVRDLGCGAYFELEDFPAHKLAMLVRSILSGKIVHDRQRMIDGLRAWAVLLLVFGRRFPFRRTVIEPIFRMQWTQNEEVCRIAADLNDLQEIRNAAAHRATMLSGAQVEEIRSRSFGVLNRLDAVLLP